MYWLDDRYLKYQDIILVDLKRPFGKKWLESKCQKTPRRLSRSPEDVWDNKRALLINVLDGVWFSLPKYMGCSLLYKTTRPSNVNRVYWALKLSEMFESKEQAMVIECFRKPLSVTLKSLGVDVVFTNSTRLQSIVTDCKTVLIPRHIFYSYALVGETRHTKVFQSMDSKISIDEVPTLVEKYVRFPDFELPDVDGKIAVISEGNPSWSMIVARQLNRASFRAYALSLLW